MTNNNHRPATAAPTTTPSAKRVAVKPHAVKQLFAAPSREAQRTAAVIFEVLAGVRTPADAAAVLGISPPRYYLWEQRAVVLQRSAVNAPSPPAAVTSASAATAQDNARSTPS